MRKLIPLLIAGPLLGVASLAIADGAASAQCSVSDGILQQTASTERTDSVRCLQSTLNEQGYHSGPVDGWFGPVTAAAVTRFQQDHGLTVDGWMGRETRTALGIERSGSSGSTRVARPSAPKGQTASAPRRSSGSGGGGVAGNCDSFVGLFQANGLPVSTFKAIAWRESGCNPRSYVSDSDDEGGGLLGLNLKGSNAGAWYRMCGLTTGNVTNAAKNVQCAGVAYRQLGLRPWS